jgi:hypothetical protein
MDILDKVLGELSSFSKDPETLNPLLMKPFLILLEPTAVTDMPKQSKVQNARMLSLPLEKVT